MQALTNGGFGVFKPVPAAWQEYRFRSVVACMGLILGFPLVALVVIMFKLWISDGSDEVLIVLVALWTLFWGWSAIHVVRFPCPRCRQPWLASQEPGLDGKRCCSHCGLSRYEAP